MTKEQDAREAVMAVLNATLDLWENLPLPEGEKIDERLLQNQRVTNEMVDEVGLRECWNTLVPFSVTVIRHLARVRNEEPSETLRQLSLKVQETSRDEEE